MSRIKIQLPARFLFTAKIPVRITDINYGNHVGNDSLLAIIHEARMQFLLSAGYTEMNICGTGLIMSDAAIEFKNELFYGDTVMVSVAASDFSRVSFTIYYKLEKEADNKKVLVCTAKTGMVCFNYNEKKIAPVPAEAIKKLSLPE